MNVFVPFVRRLLSFLFIVVLDLRQCYRTILGAIGTDIRQSWMYRSPTDSAIAQEEVRHNVAQIRSGRKVSYTSDCGCAYFVAMLGIHTCIATNALDTVSAQNRSLTAASAPQRSMLYVRGLLIHCILNARVINSTAVG